MGNLHDRQRTRGNPLKIPDLVEILRGEIAEKPFAEKITIVGDVLFVAEAEIGSSQLSAVWRVKKIDTTTGILVTWADGNANFDNIATDLTTLTYS